MKTLNLLVSLMGCGFRTPGILFLNNSVSFQTKRDSSGVPLGGGLNFSHGQGRIGCLSSFVLFFCLFLLSYVLHNFRQLELTDKIR